MGDFKQLKANYYFNQNIPFCINKRYYPVCNINEFEIHSHDFVEIAYICNGKGRHVIDGKEYPVSKGDVCVINIDTLHSFFPVEHSDSNVLSVINCIFLPDFVDKLNIELSILDETVKMLLHKHDYSNDAVLAPEFRFAGSSELEVNRIFEEMFDEYMGKQEGYVEVLKILLCKLFIKLFRNNKKHDPSASNQDGDKHRLIMDSIEYLKLNYLNKLNLKDISQHFFLSKSYFCTLFRENTGMSVVEYIQKLRIERACKYLVEEPDVKIVEIALKTGYGDYKFFNHVFKKVTSTTPKEYRKKYGRTF